MSSAVEITSGFRSGRLTARVKTKHPDRRGVFWECLCDCGNATTVYAGHLRAGARVSCGCVKGCKQTHGMSHSAEYRAWDNMRARCRNPNNIRYAIYGARGIKVCERWMNSFENFYADLGPRPSAKHSLERENNDGDYTPENCTWATSETQNNNRSSFNRYLVVNGRKMTVAQASRATGIPHATILSRLDAGKSDKEAVSDG